MERSTTGCLSDNVRLLSQVHIRRRLGPSIRVQLVNVSPLDNLPQAFRLSRISDIYNPESFQPYAISPARSDKSLLNITACVCITPDQLPATLQGVCSSGYASVVLVHPDELSGSAKRGLRGDLKAASRQTSVTNKLYLHLYSYPGRVPPPYNSLRNLGRFHSPTLSVVTAPSVNAQEPAFPLFLLRPPRILRDRSRSRNPPKGL